jgi:hypothetical protein
MRQKNLSSVAIFLATAGLFFSGSAIAQNAPGGTASTVPGTPAPPYSVLRYTEDYSYLKDPAARTDFLDPIKYIPLNSAGDWYASLGGQARYRYEYFDHANFGAGPQDKDGYHLTRLLANADIHFGDMFRLFAQGKSAMIDNRDGGPRPVDADEADIQQLFADAKIPLAEDQSLTFRFGRQELLYGAQRLIGPVDWTNVRRTFEGAKVSWSTPANTLDVFWVRPVIVDKERLNNGDGDSSFAAIYDTLSLPWLFGKSAASKIEMYGLALSKEKDATTPVDSDTYTVGARFTTNPKPFDFDLEPDYQFGRSGSGDISAWSVATEGGYTVSQLEFTPRAFLGFDAASGDNDPANPDKGTFNQLFPTGHLQLGYIDVIGRQNIVDIHPGVELTLLKDESYAKKVTLRADYRVFWRENTHDALYNSLGAVQRAAGTNRESYVGNELDLLLTWQIERHTQIYAGYSHFFAGDFIQDTGKATGADKDIDFLYAAAVFTF